MQNTNAPSKWMAQINVNGVQVNPEFNPNKKESSFFSQQMVSYVAIGTNAKFDEWNLMKSFFTEN